MNKTAAFLSMFSQHFQHDVEKTRDKQALVFPNMIVQYKYLRKMSVLSNECITRRMPQVSLLQVRERYHLTCGESPYPD